MGVNASGDLRCSCDDGCSKDAEGVGERAPSVVCSFLFTDVTESLRLLWLTVVWLGDADFWKD